MRLGIPSRYHSGTSRVSLGYLADRSRIPVTPIDGTRLCGRGCENPTRSWWQAHRGVVSAFPRNAVNVARRRSGIDEEQPHPAGAIVPITMLERQVTIPPR